MQTIAKRKYAPLWSLIVLAVLAFSIAGYAVATYLTGAPLDAGFVLGKAYFQDFKATDLWTAALLVHATAGTLALVAGGVQWVVTRLGWRRRKPAAFRRMHIVTGFTYTVAIMLGALSGAVLAVDALGGLPSAIGFALLDVLWLATTIVAMVLGNRLRKPQKVSDPLALRESHRSWMLRSFSLTAAAITLRIWLGLGVGALQLDFVAAYTVIAWLCWVPNLVVAELIIRKGRRSADGEAGTPPAAEA